MRKFIAILSISSALLLARHESDASASRDLSAIGEALAWTICAGTTPQVEQVKNKHIAGQMDRYETRNCARGEATVYIGATTSDPRGLACSVVVRTVSSGLPSYLEIGRSVEDVIAALGDPLEASSYHLTYGLSLEGVDTVTVHLEEQRVISVRWAWVVH